MLMYTPQGMYLLQISSSLKHYVLDLQWALYDSGCDHGSIPGRGGPGRGGFIFHDDDIIWLIIWLIKQSRGHRGDLSFEIKRLF